MIDDNRSYEAIEAAAGQPPGRRFYRSTTKRLLTGVCGGLAEYWGVDALLVRAVWSLSVLLTAGITLLVYALLAVLIEEESAEHATTKVVRTSERWQRIRANRPLLLGVTLIVVGFLLLLNALGLLPVRLETVWRSVTALFWPLLLIGLGILVLYSLSGRGIDWSRLRQVGARLPVRRSRQNRWIAGVCGGLGAYLDVDPMLVRVAWVVLSVFTLAAAGVLLYVLAVVMLPEAD